MRTLLFIKDELAAIKIIGEFGLSGITTERFSRDQTTGVYCLELAADLDHCNAILRVFGLNQEFAGKIIMRMEKSADWRRNN